MRETNKGQGKEACKNNRKVLVKNVPKTNSKERGKNVCKACSAELGLISGRR